MISNIKIMLMVLFILAGIIVWGIFLYDVISAIIHPPGEIPYR